MFIIALHPVSACKMSYRSKVVAEKDAALFSKEEYFKRIEEPKKGPSYELKEGETLEDLLEREG